MRELKLVEPPDSNSLYNGLLLDGEKFWPHDSRTLNEILDCLNVVKVTNRLPSCFWESISDIHATNYSSIYNLTKRMIERDYPECTTTIRPPKSFLLWIYKRLTIVSHDDGNG